MKINTLTWSEVEQMGRATRKGVVFPLPAKPVLSFAYDGLYYEDTLSLYFVDGKALDLTPAQTDELDSYIFTAFNDQLNYVHAYDKNGYYMGYIRANTAGIAGTVKFGPPTINERYRLDSIMKRWVLVGGVDQNGLYLGKPVQMTDMRFYAEVDSAPPFPYYKFDFAENSWVDGRTIEQIRATDCNALDAYAELTRLRFITPGAGQAATYQLKAAEATAYLADPAPVDANYPMLAAEATATHVATAVLALTVAAQAKAWTGIAAQIEAIRLAGKAEINQAASAESADASMALYEAQLNLVGVQP